jgi:ribosome production factor 2
LFDIHPRYQSLKTLMMDFFRSQTVETMELDGLQYVISLSVPEQDSPSVEGGSEDLPPVHFRVYLLRSKKVKGSKFPRVELEEMGPRMDLKLGRYKDADPEILALALKKPKEKEVRNLSRTETFPLPKNLLHSLLVIFLFWLYFGLGSRG